MLEVILKYLEGTLQSTNLLLSIVAFFLILLLIKRYKTNETKPFIYLAVSLLLFDFLIFFGALRSFGIYENVFITHLLPAPILLGLTYAVYLEIQRRAGKK